MSEDLLREVAHRGDPTVTLEVIRVNNPAAGADWSLVAPGQFHRRIHSVCALLTTSAAVANRGVRLQLSAPEGIVAAWPQPAVITASLGIVCTWQFGMSSSAPGVVGNALSTGIGDTIVPPGFTLQTVTSLIDAADQWSAILIRAETVENLPWTHYMEKRAQYRGELIEAAVAAEG